MDIRLCPSGHNMMKEEKRSRGEMGENEEVEEDHMEEEEGTENRQENDKIRGGEKQKVWA